jgi:hypothetical protein
MYRRGNLGSIYQGDQWIYIGTSFKNLQSRLNRHASGRRSGDKFCVYVSDRLVMKNLTDEQLNGISEGTYSLDHQIRDFIRTELSYRYVLVPDDPTARALERYGLQIAKGQAGGGVVEFSVEPSIKYFLRKVLSKLM